MHLDPMDQDHIDQDAVARYLTEMKEAVAGGRYRIARNANRADNLRLFHRYIIDEARAKQILLELDVLDFSEVRQNNHAGFEEEQLYIFGKDVNLLERYGEEERSVSLYIKINKLESCFVIVVSFHEQRYPLTYLFR